jgi:DNA-binding transcriptional LysR family regulator
MKPLDLDAVQTFALVADLGSFTRAAEAAGTTQSAVSLKLKRQSPRAALIERTPRSVRLTAEGTAYPRARSPCRQSTRAHGNNTKQTPHLSVGIMSCRRPGIPALLAQKSFDPGLRSVTIGYSRSLLDDYDRKRFDAVIAQGRLTPRRRNAG